MKTIIFALVLFGIAATVKAAGISTSTVNTSTLTVDWQPFGSMSLYNLIGFRSDGIVVWKPRPQSEVDAVNLEYAEGIISSGTVKPISIQKGP